MNRKYTFLLPALLVGSAMFANAQNKPKPEDTEFYQPVPPVVTPGKQVQMLRQMLLYYSTEKSGSMDNDKQPWYGRSLDRC
ncbi:hypothetical protein [Mucilaginibacter antarcticus]|uniref:hypothetical protein n=1 Tax=Mucilaginibacter antarcticus TaxID=1855725 RepID=UPI00363D8139